MKCFFKINIFAQVLFGNTMLLWNLIKKTGKIYFKNIHWLSDAKGDGNLTHYIFWKLIVENSYI